MRSAGMVSPPLRTKVGKSFTDFSHPPLPPVAAVATCRLPRMLWLRPPPPGREHGMDYNARDAPRCRAPLTRGSVDEELHGIRSIRPPHQCEPWRKKVMCFPALSSSTPEVQTLIFLSKHHALKRSNPARFIQWK